MFDWPHAPIHRLNEQGTYMVTAGTYNKTHFFNTQERLKFLFKLLLYTAKEFNWQMQAWALMANHYHFIAISPENPNSLRTFLCKFHMLSSKQLNIEDDVEGRKVWYQFWESRITYQRSYLARLNYVNNNPVKHGIVTNAEEYDWCSANWFKQNTGRIFRKTVYSFKTDNINVLDDF